MFQPFVCVCVGGGSWSQNTVACSLINRAYTTEVSSLVMVNTELKPSSRQEIAFPEYYVNPK